MRIGLIARAGVVLCLAAAVAGCSSAGGAGASTGPAASPIASVPAAAATPDGGTPAVAESPAPADPSSGGTDAGSGSGDTDYCAVFSLDRIASVVGAPVHVGDISDLYGTGCRWFTADGKNGVLIGLSPVHLGYDDIAAQGGQKPVTGVGDKATIGPWAFYWENGDGPHTGVQAAALAGDGFATVLVSPVVPDDAVIGLLKDLVAATR